MENNQASAFHYHYNHVKKKILAKAIGHQKNHAQPKVEGKKSMSQKIASPLHKNNGISLSLFYLFIF